MIRIELSDGALDDLERIVDFLVLHSAANAGKRTAAIVAALDILRLHPQIGRPVERGLRELVIGRDDRGYVALYRFRPELDVVSVLAIRGQREAGFS